MFDPTNNGIIYSAGEKDGIFIWEFKGDIDVHSIIDEDYMEQQYPATLNEKQIDALHQPTMLEKMRMAVREKKKPKLAEYSFIVQQPMPLIPLQNRDDGDKVHGNMTSLRYTEDKEYSQEQYYN